MAQSVERILGKDEVVSSILTSSSKNNQQPRLLIFLSKPPKGAWHVISAQALYVIREAVCNQARKRLYVLSAA